MNQRPIGMPDDVPDYVAPAWSACMEQAIANDRIRQMFEAQTSHRFSADTGPDPEYLRAFIAWANKHVWGRWFP